MILKKNHFFIDLIFLSPKIFILSHLQLHQQLTHQKEKELFFLE